MASTVRSKCDVLIIDDDPRVLVAYASYLEGTGITSRCVAYAKSDNADSVDANAVDILKSALDNARKYFPSAATVDYDLGPDRKGGRYTGNQVGRALLSINPAMRLAGITGGKSSDFDDSVFQIRSHKAAMTQESYRALCGFLLGSSSPAMDYEKWCSENENMTELLASMSVLAQGYNLGRRVQKGEQPIEGMLLARRSDAELRSFLTMIAEPEFAPARAKVSDDEVLSSLLLAIEKDMPVEDASVLHLEERLKEMMGGDKNE